MIYLLIEFSISKILGLANEFIQCVGLGQLYLIGLSIEISHLASFL